MQGGIQILAKALPRLYRSGCCHAILREHKEGLMKHSVETSVLAVRFGAKDLDKALIKLFTNNIARAALADSVDEDEVQHVLAMYDSGRPEGKASKIIRDFFKREIIS